MHTLYVYVNFMQKAAFTEAAFLTKVRISSSFFSSLYQMQIKKPLFQGGFSESRRV